MPVIMEVVKRRGWSYVALLYSSDLYGIEGASVITSLAPSYHICLVSKKAVSSEYSDVNKALLEIVKLFYNDGGAILVFASQNTADQVIRASADSVQLHDLEYIFSDAVTLQKSVFQENEFPSKRLKTTPGSLIITPVHFAIEDFQSHWREVIGNISYARELREYNPWLEYIGQNPALSDEYHNTTIYTLYAIKTAYLYASIIKEWLDSQPSLSTESPLSSDVIEYINGANINFSTDDDFPYIPRELAENKITIKFDNYRFPVAMSNADYDVYNIQLNSNEAYVKQVGKYRNGQLEMDMHNIKSYDKDKNEIAQSSLVSGLCPNGQKCEGCLKSPVDSRWIYVPGDIIVVAAIPLYRGSAAGNCDRTRMESGFQFAEAVQFAVDTVNKGDGIFSRWFRDSQGNRKKVGALLLNTCYNRYLAQKSIYSLFDGTDPTLPEWEEISKKVVGVVGSMGSSISMAMAVPLTDLNIVQVSYASTSVTLKDRNTYPYFARTCAPDDKQVYVIIQMLKQLNWRYLTVIQQSDAYGRAGSAALMDLAAKEGIGISKIHEVSTEGDTDYFNLYDQLILDSNVKVIMVFARSTIAEDILKNFEIKNPNYSSHFIFIGTESWGNRDFVIQSSGYGLGAITMLQDLPTNTLFKRYLDNLPHTDLERPRHRWWLHYWESRMTCSWKYSYNREKTNTCSKSQEFTKTPQFSQDPWDPFVINAVYSLLSGAHETLAEFCPASMEVCQEYRSNPHKLYQNVIKTILPIYGYAEFQIFDENGEGKAGYKIYHVVRDRFAEGELAYEQVGRYSREEGLTLETDKLSFRGYDGIPTFENMDKDAAGTTDTANGDVNGTKNTVNGEDNNTSMLLAVALVPIAILLIIIIIIVVIFYTFWKKIQTEKQKHDEYLTVAPQYEAVYHGGNLPVRESEEPPRFEKIDEMNEEPAISAEHTRYNSTAVVDPYVDASDLHTSGDSGYITACQFETKGVNAI